MSESKAPNNNEVPTLLVNDSTGNELLCFLEQIVPIKETEYVLLTPVDTPVSLFRLREDNDPELIKTIKKKEQSVRFSRIPRKKKDIVCPPKVQKQQH